MRLSLLLVASTLATSLPAVAQEKMKPEGLVRMLLENRMGVPGQPASSIVVGELPSGFPSDLKLPEGARVLGGMTTSSSMYSSQGLSTAVLAVNGSAGEARRAIEQALAAANWTAAAAPVRSEPLGFQRQGFQMQRMTPYAPSFCKEGMQMRISLQPEQRQLTYVRLDFTDTGPSRRSCGAQPSSAFEDIPLPALDLPEGATQISGGGSSRGPRSASTNMTFETPASAGDIVLHFAPQLQRQGWTRVGDKIGDGSASSLGKLQKDDRDWRGMVVVVEVGDAKLRYALLHVQLGQ